MRSAMGVSCASPPIASKRLRAAATPANSWLRAVFSRARHFGSNGRVSTRDSCASSPIAVRDVQVAALKQTTFRLLHGKALFQFLQVQSELAARSERAEILAHFRPGRSYESAIIAEHGVYLRKACSYLCANHLGSEVVQDAAFLDPMQRYEELYTEYFNLYCSAWSMPPTRRDRASAVAAAEEAAARIPVGDSRPAPRATLPAARGGTAPADRRYADGSPSFASRPPERR